MMSVGRLEADRRHSSKGQFEAQLKAWHVRKHLKLEEWKVIFDTFDKITPSTECRIMLFGREVKEETIHRARRQLRSARNDTRRRSLHKKGKPNALSLRNIKQAWIETLVDGKWHRYNDSTLEETLEVDRNRQIDHYNDLTNIHSHGLSTPSLLPRPSPIVQREPQNSSTVIDHASLGFSFGAPDEPVSGNPAISNPLPLSKPGQTFPIEPEGLIWDSFSVPDIPPLTFDNQSASNQLPTFSPTHCFPEISIRDLTVPALLSPFTHVGRTEPSRNTITLDGNTELGINTDIGSLSRSDSANLSVLNGSSQPALTQVENLSVPSSSIGNAPFTLNLEFWSRNFAGLPSTQFTCDLPLRPINKISNYLINGRRGAMWNPRGTVQLFFETISGSSPCQSRSTTGSRLFHIVHIARKLANMLPGQVVQAHNTQALGIVSAPKILDADFEQSFMRSLVNGLAGLEDIPVDLIGKFFCHPDIMSTLLSSVSQMSSTHATKAFVNCLVRVAVESNNHQLLRKVIKMAPIDFNEMLFENTTRYPQFRGIKRIGALEYAVAHGFPQVAEVLFNV